MEAGGVEWTLGEVDMLGEREVGAACPMRLVGPEGYFSIPELLPYPRSSLPLDSKPFSS